MIKSMTKNISSAAENSATLEQEIYKSGRKPQG